jgi:hypothetical protein
LPKDFLYLMDDHVFGCRYFHNLPCN